MKWNEYSSLGLALLIVACGSEGDLPKPEAVALNADAIGHYCRMDLLEHDGPKAQIHITTAEEPVWFTQIRDAIAYTRLPEETSPIAAIYVNDMGKAASWAAPGETNWIDADDAFFVIGSQVKGGMGSAEAIPFGEREDAEQFVEREGGSVVALDDIPDQYVLSAVDQYLQLPGRSRQHSSQQPQKPFRQMPAGQPKETTP